MKQLKWLKRYAAAMLVLAVAAAANGCAGKDAQQGGMPEAGGGAEPIQQTELIVFAAASMTESLQEIAELYREEAPEVTLVFNFDSSGTLKTQIEQGADCDIFISAGQKQMNELDIAAGEKNPEGLDFVLQGTRIDLLENKVVLIVPKGNEKGIIGFEDLDSEKVSLISLGNADVPVGQYAQDILEYMDFWDKLRQEQKISFASNVKEVLSQVEKMAADCGIVYQTDAKTALGIEVIAYAPESSHQPVIYPAAVLSSTSDAAQAQRFLNFLRAPQGAAVLTRVGFTVIK